MTELSFLLELLLNHKLPQATKKAVTERVKEVEQGLSTTHMHVQDTSGFTTAQISAQRTLQAIPPHLVGQAPSTIAAMMRNGFTPEGQPAVVTNTVEFRGVQVQPPEPQPVAVIAQTPAAAAAIADRQNAISQAISGKPEKGRTSPRKF